MDTCISYYHQCVNYEGYSGTFDEFCKLFLFDKSNIIVFIHIKNITIVGLQLTMAHFINMFCHSGKYEINQIFFF
jgi:hypothetical protein